ncbi:cupin domain-containing protein [Thiomicrorhabdus sp.]|uniref:cupin domain-containing protein n=1 Tax=Thiomicrorhabdus sp. TaxID=2039724 RepID=UPI002AA74F75|nr:cupin domain-containing protein [Thiomicrorhabdus sp.]
MNIEIISQPSEQQLAELGVLDWPIWEKEASSFPWTYDMKEVCYILQGLVTVTPEQGDAVTIKAGDLVTFPRGMVCHWDIAEDIRKHYQFM